jgi:hypothetical protein
MRTTIDLDPYLLKRLRDEAHRRGIPFKDLLTIILRRGLDERPTGARPRYRAPSYSMGAPVSDVQLDKALHLAATFEDEETRRKVRVRK